ncbi:MAG: ribose-phosphate pyrophosphokinase [Planctomycetes bacterium]|nr:ribose-phosphate pyrophosphokinase [Planctomycetota bacterium]NOG54558.1 ribose-phosphate pyrophosphokinase [Planctomycetota bacterium]
MTQTAGSLHLRVFAGRASRRLGEAICERLDRPIGQCGTDLFPDGEIIVKIEEDVRGKDCFVVQSTCRPVNDNLLELLIFIDCLRRASAHRITAVIPYYGYARQDRKDEGRTPITAKMVANLITQAGADRVLTLDLHAAQIQGFFDIPVDHLTAAPVFCEYFRSIRDELGDLALVSPDVGNVKVANMYASLLEGELAIIDKRRCSGTDVKAVTMIGDVKDRSVLMIDDMISTAGTVCEAAKLVRDRGAKRVMVAATHGVLAGMAMERLADPSIDRVILTDSIPLDGRCDAIKDKLICLSVDRLMAEAIYRINHDMSISALFQDSFGSKR